MIEVRMSSRTPGYYAEQTLSAIRVETLNAVKVAGQSGSAVRRSLAYSVFSGSAMS